MPPVLGPRSPSPARLWSWAEANSIARAIAKREKRNLLAVEEILNEDILPRLAKFARKHPVDRGFRLFDARRHDDALARREPVGLDDNRRALREHISLRGGSTGKAGIGRRRYFVAGAKILREGFGAFEPGGRVAWTEGPDPCRGQLIDDTGDKRRLRADNDEIDVIRLAKSNNRRMIF